jgi:hypothetical protein
MIALSALLIVLSASAQPQDISSDAATVDASSAPSCVGSSASYPNAPAVYQIVPDGSVPPGIAGTAASAWDDPSCNPGGTGFPEFTTNPTPGAVQVPVHYSTGLNPANSRSCGQFDPATGSITLFSQAAMPNGGTGSCGSTAIETQSLEHELGHRLGLSDQNSTTCPGYIMSQVAYPPQTGPIPPQPLDRSIHPAECNEAN